jgi:sterol desaturase/sphingolipid hydroxylase (fatty acid hydroxylase superfamily)
MVNLVIYAIPAFLLLLAVEALAYRHATEDHLPGYEARDTATSLSMGIGNVVINLFWKAIVLAAFVGVYELTPLRIPADAWWAWVLLFFADDLAYYWFHRAHHEVRFFWASHVVHHSSQHYNLSTALRQTWTPMTGLPFWLPLAAAGFKPWMILLAQSWSLLYQFWIHTEKLRRLPRWFEAVFNTPSHHRVHHGSNPQYLDRNHAGILIVWDKLFGTFEPEAERVRYGLTKNIESHHPVHVAFHEFRALWGDVRRAPTWRVRVAHLLRGPGWQHPADEASPHAPAPPLAAGPGAGRRPAADHAA